MDIFLFICYI